LQSTIVLIVAFHPHHSPVGIVWMVVTAAVMFALAFGKEETGAALNNPVLRAEGRITIIDGPSELGEGASGLWCEPTTKKHLRPRPR
jgi:hypothetical protein